MGASTSSSSLSDSPATGAPPRDDAQTVRIPKELGGFVLEKRIGKGGMGFVYRALQPSLDRTVALKVLSPFLSDDDEIVARFHREARSAGALQHPNVVKIYDSSTDAGFHFFSTEYITGGSLEDLLDRERRLPLARALEIARDVARALAFAEDRGMVHRDIKPANILLTSDGLAKVADMGLAKRTDPNEGALTVAGQVMGTPYYMAPEQARSQDLDIRCDIYALGVTLFRCLTGKIPFRPDHPDDGSLALAVLTKKVTEEVPSVRTVDPDLSGEVDALVARMTRRDPDDRVRSAHDVLRSLEELLAPDPSEAPAGSDAALSEQDRDASHPASSGRRREESGRRGKDGSGRARRPGDSGRGLKAVAASDSSGGRAGSGRRVKTSGRTPATRASAKIPPKNVPKVSAGRSSALASPLFGLLAMAGAVAALLVLAMIVRRVGGETEVATGLDADAGPDGPSVSEALRRAGSPDSVAGAGGAVAGAEGATGGATGGSEAPNGVGSDPIGTTEPPEGGEATAGNDGATGGGSVTSPDGGPGPDGGASPDAVAGEPTTGGGATDGGDGAGTDPTPEVDTAPPPSAELLAWNEQQRRALDAIEAGRFREAAELIRAILPVPGSDADPPRPGSRRINDRLTLMAGLATAIAAADGGGLADGVAILATIGPITPLLEDPPTSVRFDARMRVLLAAAELTRGNPTGAEVLLGQARVRAVGLPTVLGQADRVERAIDAIVEARRRAFDEPPRTDPSPIDVLRGPIEAVIGPDATEPLDRVLDARRALLRPHRAGIDIVGVEWHDTLLANVEKLEAIESHPLIGDGPEKARLADLVENAKLAAKLIREDQVLLVLDDPAAPRALGVDDPGRYLSEPGVGLRRPFSPTDTEGIAATPAITIKGADKCLGLELRFTVLDLPSAVLPFISVRLARGHVLLLGNWGGVVRPDLDVAVLDQILARQHKSWNIPAVRKVTLRKDKPSTFGMTWARGPGGGQNKTTIIQVGIGSRRTTSFKAQVEGWAGDFQLRVAGDVAVSLLVVKRASK